MTMLETAAITLEIPLHPIRLLPLSDTGTMPDAVTETAGQGEEILHQPQYLPPRNQTERQLLSAWVNTHQAMFMTIAMSSYAIGRALRAIHRRDLLASLEWLGFAREARYASSAYTDLPALRQTLYEAYLRESMKCVHPGFSGVSNLESIMMELALRQLKQAVIACQAEDRAFAQRIGTACEEVAEADEFWWRAHGQAMRCMVRRPVSLARMDAQEKAKEKGMPSNFEEYREKVLREPKALKEYDAYFAVERRRGLSLDGWQRRLERALATADDYTARHGPVVGRARPARPQLFALLKHAAG
jgi:hypothetical protein